MPAKAMALFDGSNTPLEIPCLSYEDLPEIESTDEEEPSQDGIDGKGATDDLGTNGNGGNGGNGGTVDETQVDADAEETPKNEKEPDDVEWMECEAAAEPKKKKKKKKKKRAQQPEDVAESTACSAPEHKTPENIKIDTSENSVPEKLIVFPDRESRQKYEIRKIGWPKHLQIETSTVRIFQCPLRGVWLLLRVGLSVLWGMACIAVVMASGGGGVGGRAVGRVPSESPEAANRRVAEASFGFT